MKKLLLVITGLGLITTCFAQGEYKKRPSLGVHFILNDFRTAQNLRTSGLPGVIRSKEWHKTKNMTAGLALSYLQGLSNNLDFVGTLSGSFLDYPIAGKAPRNNPSMLTDSASPSKLRMTR